MNSKLSNGVKIGSVLAKAAILNLISKDRARSYLIDSFVSLPGLPAKASQLLGRKLELNEKLSQSKLENQNNSIPLESVLEILKSEQPVLTKKIKEIDSHPKLASLGQVHQITLEDGTLLAVKVQFPNIKETLFSQLDILFSSFQALSSGKLRLLDSAGYKEYFTAQFEAELNYQEEGVQQTTFSQRLSSVDHLVIPKVWNEFSCSSVLTQSYEPSVTLQDIKKESLEIRRLCANRLLRIFLTSLISHGCVHADLHEKNWGYRPDSDSIVLYDFGSVLFLDTSIVEALLSLIAATEDKASSNNHYLSGFVALGFDAMKLMPIADRLGDICRIIFLPLLRRGSLFDAAEWNLTDSLKTILGADRWYFRAAGPPWFLVLMKTVFSLTTALRVLEVKVSLADIFFEVLKKNKPVGSGFLINKTSQYNQADNSTSSPSLNEQPLSLLTNSIKKSLKIRVLENGRELVFIELPVQSADDLAILVPPESRKKIESMGYDLNKIAAQVKYDDYPKRELFACDIGAKSYRVWIE